MIVTGPDRDSATCPVLSNDVWHTGRLCRYLHGQSPDGIAGDEGAFLLCR
jgi:hypothetical protein